ncbi:hypothetical protein AGMMS49525_06550 [Bacteroidia bacterium]|nr:hypothetical protein AGMMS49525_06550 [Bacteroidia bacterium]
MVRLVFRMFREHTPFSWKAQSDSVTYKVDLGNTNVYVPYGTGTASTDYTAITNASNGLMVLPQETVLGAFTGSTPEYGTVAEVAASPANASYLYATVAEVNYLTNDTVNTRQVVFRLHDPANKAQGIVFEAGRQYTFLLTLGLDGEEIVFSIPTVTAYNESAVVDAPKLPFPCGKPFKGYTTANYSNPDLENLCWTTQNIAEGSASYDTYYDGSGTISPSPTKGQRGYYYAWGAEAEAACKELGADWSVPDDAQWTALQSGFSALSPGAGTTGNPLALQSDWNAGHALAGIMAASNNGVAWGVSGNWWSSMPSGTSWFVDIGVGATVLNGPGPGGATGSVRCVRGL